MTTMEFIITNNLMTGLALKTIAENFPCFFNLSNTDIENLDDIITVTITCRKEDAPHIKEYLAPFV